MIIIVGYGGKKGMEAENVRNSKARIHASRFKRTVINYSDCESFILAHGEPFPSTQPHFNIRTHRTFDEYIPLLTPTRFLITRNAVSSFPTFPHFIHTNTRANVLELDM